MFDQEPDLYATLTQSTGEIVYLLIIPDANKRTLILMSTGVESQSTTGTEFETRQLAEESVIELVKNGFQRQAQGMTFDTLQSTKAVALRLGYRFINDPGSRTALNFLGRTSLADWPGAPGVDDPSWEYALDYAKINARPKLQAQLLQKKMSGKEFAAAMAPAIQKQKATGGEQSFTLTRN
jgi:hypothetical protein